MFEFTCSIHNIERLFLPNDKKWDRGLNIFVLFFSEAGHIYLSFTPPPGLFVPLLQLLLYHLPPRFPVSPSPLLYYGMRIPGFWQYSELQLWPTNLNATVDSLLEIWGILPKMIQANGIEKLSTFSWFVYQKNQLKKWRIFTMQRFMSLIH